MKCSSCSEKTTYLLLPWFKSGSFERRMSGRRWLRTKLISFNGFVHQSFHGVLINNILCHASTDATMDISTDPCVATLCILHHSDVTCGHCISNYGQLYGYVNNIFKLALHKKWKAINTGPPWRESPHKGPVMAESLSMQWRLMWRTEMQYFGVQIRKPYFIILRITLRYGELHINVENLNS